MEYHFGNKNSIFNELLNERASKFNGVKDKIDHNKLIYDFKTEGKISKDFGDYQIPLELFEKLRNSDLLPKEVLKSQIKFKLDLNQARIEGNKSENQKNIIKKILIIFLSFEQKLLILLVQIITQLVVY